MLNGFIRFSTGTSGGSSEHDTPSDFIKDVNFLTS